MSVPISQFIPPTPFPPLVSTRLFSTSVSLFLLLAGGTARVIMSCHISFGDKCEEGKAYMWTYVKISFFLIF